ncbi:LOW QUALITY PROTEIN: hypothetical protein U9M48_002270 [Paspalum notatum var. saurae]|uniref:Reverse transcriptase zinc-binding domain-containing protein n=1 Tax=Paspalum notatum var. saurae TaxID=547442 RepID=A0AAQ3SFW7_PASNO
MESPHIYAVESKGLDESRQAYLITSIQNKAKELSNYPMLVTLCEEAGEILSNMNHPAGDCPLCLYPLIVQGWLELPFMKLMSCYHCFHSDCIMRWWEWLQHGDADPKETGAQTSLIMVQAVLTATSIHHLIALDLPKWVIKAIDKRGFLWKGQEQANGGHCLISWDKVQRPLELEGLGIHNLEVLGWSLRIRWLWAQKIDPNRPWAGFNISIPPKAKALFDVAMVSVVGNGESVLFWKDRWLPGKTVGEVAPSLLKTVSKRTANCRTVAQALLNRAWVSDIGGAFTLWDVVEAVVLGEGPDQHIWKFTQSGCYTSKSAYSAFFEGSVKFKPWRLIWKSWAPLRCKFFLWLAKNNRCWTADRLAKRGLPHPDACPLCDQADETLQHILIGCVFSRQIWDLILQSLQLAEITPTMADSGFFSWWKFRNLCVFEGMQPNVQLLLHRIGSEGILWCAAGASGLLELLNRSLTPASLELVVVASLTVDLGEDEKELLNSEAEQNRRKRIESVVNLQQERNGLIEPKKDLAMQTGMYVSLPPSTPDTTGEVNSAPSEDTTTSTSETVQCDLTNNANSNKRKHSGHRRRNRGNVSRGQHHGQPGTQWQRKEADTSHQ